MKRPPLASIVGFVVGLFGLLASVGTASAHVRYVVDDAGDVTDAATFVAETLSDPVNAALVGGTAVLGLVTLVGYWVLRPFSRDIEVFRAVVANYDDLLPWLLRLSVGLPMVGAGFAGYYFTPIVRSDTRLLFVGIGFLLLFGLATRTAAITGLLAYVVGVVLEPALLLQFEFVGGLVAVALLGGGRPSADDVLNHVAQEDDTFYGRVDPFHRLAVQVADLLDPYEQFVPTIVRGSLGFTFVYLGLVEKLLNPGAAISVVQKYDLTAVVPVSAELWVVGAGLAEITVGLLLLTGAFTRAAAGLAFVLFTLTLFGLADDPVLAHVSLYGLASLLIVTGAGPFSVDHWLHRDETMTGDESVFT